jgi:lipopolysaccharide/colanic/teichoic acid biosynthesis glycosyltransferase
VDRVPTLLHPRPSKRRSLPPAPRPGRGTRAPRRQTVVAERYARREWILRRLLAGSDCLAITLSLLLAALLHGRSDLARFVGLGLLTLPAWLVLIRAYGLYDRDPKRINCSTIDDIPGMFHTVFIGTVLLWGYFRLLLVPRFGLAQLLTFAASAGLLLLVGRAAVRREMSLHGRRRSVVVGQGPATNLLVRKLAAHPEYGLTVVGSLRALGPSNGHGNGTASSQRAENGGGAEDGIPVLGAAADVERIAADHGVDRVIVTPQGIDENELIHLLRRCKHGGLHVSVLPQIFDVMGPSVEIDDVEGVTMLGLAAPVLSRSSRAQKRAMDILGSLIFLMLTAPLFLIIAVAIRLDSRGPVLFIQSRIGRGGRPLRIYKFRTMARDAEAQRDRLAAFSQDPNWLKLDDDPRITRVGRLLRMSSLDELPQLLNVLRGEMSLVGPRPGITGLWQVLGRTNIPFEEMVKLDYLYVTNWSLWSDVRLMLHTLPAVLHRRGAN